MRKYSKRQINNAGDILKSPQKYSLSEVRNAQDILTYWRTIHGALINTFQVTLRNKIDSLKFKNALIAQRLKRAESIVSKLDRMENMHLSRMQDIAGIRAVLRNNSEVRKLEKNYRNSKFKHKLVGEKDYIKEPASSGYRGIHLIYKYVNERNEESNDLK